MKETSSFTIRNASILVDSGTRFVDVGVRAGRIDAIRRADPERVKEKGDYDAKNRLVLPGLIDCHTHLFSLASLEEMVNLQGVRSTAEMRRRIRSFKNEMSQSDTCRGWVLGRGWDQELFVERRFPTRKDLDRASGDFPAIMTRVCGHVGVLNTLAIEELSKRKILTSFEEDLVPLSSDGRPTGIVKEAALEACWNAVTKRTLKQLKVLFLRAQKTCLGHGLTGVHCILSDDWENELSCIEELDRKSKLVLKVSILLPIGALNRIENLTGKGTVRLKGRNFLVIGFKLYVDGSLGARTAALNDPYSDDPRNRGILNYSTQQLIGYVRRAKRLGFVLACHAIGDRAIEQVLNAYEHAGIKPEDGFRIEHCSVLRKSLLKQVRIATLCVQPMFSKSDFWIKERIGESGTRFAYPFRTLHRLTAVIGGSDAPVESIDPLTGIDAALKNKNQKESLTLKESVDLYTKSAALASPMTKDCGTISLGKICDLVILNCSDLGTVSKPEAEATFVGGKLVSGRFQ